MLQLIGKSSCGGIEYDTDGRFPLQLLFVDITRTSTKLCQKQLRPLKRLIERMNGWMVAVLKHAVELGDVGFLQLNWVYKSVTSDNRVADSRPAGCKSSPRAD